MAHRYGHLTPGLFGVCGDTLLELCNAQKEASPYHLDLSKPKVWKALWMGYTLPKVKYEEVMLIKRPQTVYTSPEVLWTWLNPSNKILELLSSIKLAPMLAITWQYNLMFTVFFVSISACQPLADDCFLSLNQLTCLGQVSMFGALGYNYIRSS
jgi:hypothetical protein